MGIASPDHVLLGERESDEEGWKATGEGFF